jgi:predicted PhzF superfamily epimerase YddE/YHI9
MLFDTGRVPEGDRYVVSQGAVLGRRGRVYIEGDGEGIIWVGGGTVSSSWLGITGVRQG